MPANCLLLLGAGFSKNWGGRLAREITADLQSRLQDNSYALELLNRTNFEDALTTVQGIYAQSASQENERQLNAMQEALLDAFSAMNEVFETMGTMEFSSDIARSIRALLVGFDAIFTLNQDLLIELNYLNEDAALWYEKKWQGYHLPGLRPIQQQSAANRRTKFTWVPNAPFEINLNSQPYFKLHGSIAWQTTDGLPLLVIGRDKVGTIRHHPILHWNSEQFKQFLARPNTRLMVIGYSFTDDHINETIVNAHQNGSLKLMYLVHPAGKDILEKHPKAAIKVPQPLQEIPCIECRTPLRVTFSTDEVERKTLFRIFQ